MGTKGDWQRPHQVSDEEWERRWEKTFGRKREEEEPKAEEEDDA